MVGCTEEEDYLSPAQSDLLGKAVNFNASIAEPFTTRTSYHSDGRFNENDIMTIYRQYYNETSKSFDASTQAYRVYHLDTKYATGTTISLGTDWKPLAYHATNYPYAYGSNSPGNTFEQTAADSLTWENGSTVRFRAWSRSNYSGVLNNGSKGTYYPDYCVSGWVNVSGPTNDIPLRLNHQGCRIGFSQKPGNELRQAEICTDWKDYKRLDNSTDNEHDTSASESGKTDDQAKAEAAEVVAVYNRMCMPAGVDVSSLLLTTMTQTLYTNTTDFKTIHIKTATDGIVAFNEKDSVHIRTDVQRPVFSSNINNQLYMITIPYDMSTADTQGETLTLPACTRFKVWLYDVNSGDNAQTSTLESDYHIFSLSDITDDDGNAMFPNGLELKPGYSYMFTVGYHYDVFSITPVDNFSWSAQDAQANTGVNQTTSIETPAERFKWWKDAIQASINAIAEDNSKEYNPDFHIDTAEEFKELIELVNGTAVVDAAKNGGLTRVYDPTKTYTLEKPATKENYRWYRTSDVVDGVVQKQNGVLPDSVSRSTAESEGYIFYQHYYPADGTNEADNLEDYLRGPYSFYDGSLRRHFTVNLDSDIDFGDDMLETIGYVSGGDTIAFRGIFEGGMYTLKNIYMNGGYLFNYCFDASFSHLKIETTHNFMFLNESKPKADNGYGADFIGISIKAPSSGNPFAKKLTGSSYVVGCIYEGEAGGAMVGEADNLFMYGNMMAASGLDATKGAMLGAYAEASNAFFAPQTSLTWGRFMVNYYDITLSPDVTAVGGVNDAYNLPQQYIRGAESYILKAKNDNLLDDNVSYDQLTSSMMKRHYYGWAPWKAMNYAIYVYNQSAVGQVQPCNAHFENNTVGYAHTYPTLVGTAPTTADYGSLNIFKLNN